MTRYVSLNELVRGARSILGSKPAVRDIGLLESALARPQTTVFGEDAYPSFHEKAAALLHSLTTNHALVDGNKRLGFATTIVFAHYNGYAASAGDEDAWFDLVLSIADGELAEVHEIADRLQPLLTPQPD